MRLISWNVNGRRKRIADQVDAIIAQKCDFVALQEITQTSALIYQESFQNCGWPYVTDSFQGVADRSLLTGPRRYGVLIASRWPMKRLSGRGSHLLWPERLLSTAIQSPGG